MLRISVAAAAVAILGLSTGHVAADAHALAGFATVTPSLSPAGAGAIADIPWSEHVYSAATGESVDVSVSTSYPAREDIGRHWADFFASLLHGPELGLLKAYVAPLDQVQTICGMSAVGCYGDDQLVLVNEPALGFSPEEVARHEYGHHVALNRLNSPWAAFDWGAKRWATAANICARVQSGRAYPGDESLLYKLNPGEAFAETYRILIDTTLGQTQLSWPLVDSSFYPDRRELDAVEQDVIAPWTGPRTRVFHARLNRSSTWQTRLPTPLDGAVTLSVALPSGVHGRVALLATKGRKLLAFDRSSRPTRLAVRTDICGERSMIALVTAANGHGRRFEVRVTVP
jgi:hypothetical protein